jgi:hypothetical protein
MNRPNLFKKKRSHWSMLNSSQQGVAVRLAICVGIISVLVGLLSYCGEEKQTKTSLVRKSAAPQYIEYRVQSGDFLIKIAADHATPWQSVLVLNEGVLADLADERCGKLRGRYTKSKRRKGYYCNEMLSYQGKRIVHANSLKPGDMIRFLKEAAPVSISEAVAAVSGKNIVVVVDDTGSMSDNRQQVTAWYLNVIEKSGKEIRKVILFADGEVRELNAGKVEFQTVGEVENTRAALERAMTYNPDAIVLVSDEPGDDWRGFKDLKLVPVIAHSIDRSADDNLRHVAKLSGGQFVSGVGDVPLARR